MMMDNKPHCFIPLLLIPNFTFLLPQPTTLPYYYFASFLSFFYLFLHIHHTSQQLTDFLFPFTSFSSFIQKSLTSPNLNNHYLTSHFLCNNTSLPLLSHLSSPSTKPQERQSRQVAVAPVTATTLTSNCVQSSLGTCVASCSLVSCSVVS